MVSRFSLSSLLFSSSSSSFLVYCLLIRFTKWSISDYEILFAVSFYLLNATWKLQYLMSSWVENAAPCIIFSVIGTHGKAEKCLLTDFSDQMNNSDRDLSRKPKKKKLLLWPLIFYHLIDLDKFNLFNMLPFNKTHTILDTWQIKMSKLVYSS